MRIEKVGKEKGEEGLALSWSLGKSQIILLVFKDVGCLASLGPVD